MKILPILLLFAPVFLFGQGKVGVGTITPDHPFQVNVDSIWTDTIEDYYDPFHVAFTLGLAIAPGSQKGAQRFPVTQTGFLSSIKFYFAIPTNATEVLIEVFRGSGPEGEFMASGNLYNVTIGTATLHFAQPWSWVEDGDTLNVVMTPVSGASCKWRQGLYAPPDIPPYLAFHYTGSWDTITHSLALATYITFNDTLFHQVFNVRDDRRVMINDYTLPRYDGSIGELLQSNGNGEISWLAPNEISGVNKIQDLDTDTKITVEDNPDEDIIRLRTAGTERMTILADGKVGIGTNLPTAKLHLNSGPVLFSGPAGDLPAMPADPPASGSGTRMMWYPDKSAFRVGRVMGTAWDKDSIGLYSFAGGFGNMAKGIFGFVGSGEGGNNATGTHTFVGNGRDNIASGNYAFIGSGNDNNATGIRSFVGGGSGNTASGQYAAIVGGNGNIASGDFAFIGSGPNLFARSYGESVFGTYATDYTPMSPTSFNDADRLFVIGNGTSNANRKDAFTIYKNGNIGVGTSAPENKIRIEGSTTSTQHIVSVQNNYSGTSHVRAVEAISTPSNGYGIGGYFTGGFKGVHGIGSASGSVSGTITGVEGTASGGSGGTRIGVYGTASGGDLNYAGYFANGNVRVDNNMHVIGRLGVGSFPNSGKLYIIGSPTSQDHVAHVSTAYTGSFHVRAIEGVSVPAAGWGYGGHFTGGAVGVYGNASAGASTATCIGIDGNASGTAGTRIGVRGSASGGATNWAGYFNQGNVYINNELRIGSDALTGATGYKVAIDGKLIAEEVRVQLSADWPDYVFKDDYPLLPLDEVDHFIETYGHLPGIPSADQVEREGHHLGEIQIKLLEKIEELTLHLIQLQKQNEVLAQRVSDLENPTKTGDQ